MRTLFLYIQDTLSDWEYGYVLAELHNGRFLKDSSHRYDILFCGRTMAPVTTMGGIPIVPDTLIADIRPSAGDLLLLPGADTWLEPDHGPVIAKVREILDNGSATVASICGATLALADAGLLDTRPHTSNDLAALKMFCRNYHGEEFYRNEPAVTDGGLITASGLAPVDFAYHIFRAMDVMAPPVLEAWYNLNTTRKPEYFFALMESLNTTHD